ncbi:MAG: TIGR01212 family radical SAM protein [Parachlamydiales bacterium]|nr:TIGR01212 family radical SAM protein [Parachlamydiales bacterium]
MKKHLTFNEYLKKLFHKRIYKVSVDVFDFTCPNRDGTKSIGGCIYCDQFGSSSRVHTQKISIKEQILKNIEIRKTRYKAKKFIVYFQSFSNTYKDVDILEKLYDEAVFSHPDIVGISISTRSDCIDEEKVKMISKYRKFLPFVSIELGLQSMHNKTLKLINRGETFEDFLKASHLIKKHNIHLCAHVILGLPNETKEEMLQTAKQLAKLNIDGVKLHMLIVLKNTILADMYKNGLFKPLSFDQYVDIASDFIKLLPKSTIIHRTSGSGYVTDIIEPKWIYDDKINIIDSIIQKI